MKTGACMFWGILCTYATFLNAAPEHESNSITGLLNTTGGHIVPVL